MKILTLTAIALMSFNVVAACMPPAEFYQAIPVENFKLVTTDGKYTFTRSNEHSVFDVYEIAAMNDPRVSFTRYLLSDFSNRPVVRNGKKLKCHFTVTKTGEETVIDYKLYKSWNDTGGYISRNTGNIVIREGKVISAELKDSTSYKNFTPVYFPFKVDEQFKY